MSRVQGNSKLIWAVVVGTSAVATALAEQGLEPSPPVEPEMNVAAQPRGIAAARISTALAGMALPDDQQDAASVRSPDDEADGEFVKFAELGMETSFAALGFGQHPSGFTILPIATGETTRVAVSFATDRKEAEASAYRVVAIDSAGTRHLPSRQNSASGNGNRFAVVTLVPEFKIPTAEIKNLIVERRRTVRERGTD